MEHQGPSARTSPVVGLPMWVAKLHFADVNNEREGDAKAVAPAAVKASCSYITTAGNMTWLPVAPHPVRSEGPSFGSANSLHDNTRSPDHVQAERGALYSCPAAAITHIASDSYDGVVVANPSDSSTTMQSSDVACLQQARRHAAVAAISG